MSSGGTRQFSIIGSTTETILGTFTNTPLQIWTNNTVRLSIASTGAATFSSNIAIAGQTLSAWGGTFGVIQSYYGSYFGGTSGGGTVMGNNNYFDGTNYKYVNTDYAGQIQIGSGNILLRVAASGTSGNNITYTNALTIASTGAATFSGNITGQNGIYQSNAADAIASNRFDTYNGGGTEMEFNYPASGAVVWKNGSERMRLNASGYVGIGCSPDWLFKIEKNTASGGGGQYPAMVINNTNAAGYMAYYFFSGATNKGGLEFSNGTNELLISSVGTVKISTLGTGAVTATAGVLSTTSDMNLKISDGYIDTALDKILKLTPRYFYWKEESGLPTDLRQLGFYAQEVNEVLGEEVANTPKTEKDKWGIYDRAIIAMLVKSIQELEARLKTIENK